MVQGMSAVGSRRRRERPVEWPTLGLAFLIYAVFFLATWYHALIPVWVMLPLGAVLLTLYGSLQHEIIHGHPTGSRRFNDLIGVAPFYLWLPYKLYKKCHLRHHNNDRLTDPLDDPESYYVPRGGWSALSRPARTLLLVNQTLSGRLTLGVPLAVFGLWRAELRRLVVRGDRRNLGLWVEHAGLVALLLLYVVGVAGMPLWEYVLCFAFAGTSLAMLRSFDEHRPAESIGGRCTIVEAGAFFRLLFFNNNYHALHHLYPAVAWYRLPVLYRQKRDAILAWNEGFLRHGYGEIFRRYLWRRRDHPAHPYA